MSCLYPITLKDEQVPCGNCYPCRENRALIKKGQQLLEYNLTNSRSLMITLTYDRENLPRTDGHTQTAIYRESDLGFFEGLKALKGETHRYEPDDVILWKDETEEFRQNWLDMMRAKKSKSAQATLRRRYKTFVLGKSFEMDLLYDAMVDNQMENLEEPYAIIYNRPGAPTLSKRHQRLFTLRLNKHLRKAGIEKHTYYMVGEYGTLNYRPHWHMNLFIRESKLDLSTHEWESLINHIVKKAWKLGSIDVCSFTEGSAGYLSGYLTEKKTGRIPARSAQNDDFERPDGSIAEQDWQSTKPALGHDAIPEIIKGCKASATIYKRLSDKERVKLKRIEDLLDSSTDYDQEIRKYHLVERPFTLEEFLSVKDMTLLGSSLLNIRTTEKLGKNSHNALPMSNLFRRRLFAALNLTDENRNKIRAYNQAQREAEILKLSPVQQVRLADDNINRSETRKRKRRFNKKRNALS